MDFAVPTFAPKLPAWDKHFAGVTNYQYPVMVMALAYANAKRRAVALDGGAHVGYWARVLVLAYERTLAFEPNLLLLECLRANAPRAEIHAEALGDAPGRCRVRVMNCENSGSGEIERDRGPIPITTIDALALPALDFVKLDLQGGEPAALKGGRETLLRFKPTLCIEGAPGGEAERFVREELGASVCARLGGDFVAGWEFAHTHGAFRTLPA